MNPRPPAASSSSTAWLAALSPALAAAAGVGLGWAWATLPAVLWWPLALALLAAVAVAALAGRPGRRRQQAGPRELVDELDRQRRQWETAEPLAELARFEWRPTSGLQLAAEPLQRLLGAPAADVAGALQDPAWLQRHLHADDAARVLAGLQAAWDGGTRYDGRFRLHRGDGSLRHVHARADVLADAQGRPERLLGVLLDETARVRAEEARRLAQLALDAVPDPVSVIDDEMNYRLTNDAWFTATGVSRKHVGPIHFDHVFPVSAERRQVIIDGLQGGRTQVVRRLLPPPLRPGRVMETRYVPVDDAASGRRWLVMASRDLTEHELVREQLTARLEQLTLTLNTIGDAVFATDALSADEPVLFANDQLLALWGIPPEEAQPLTARTIMRYAVLKLRDPQGQTARIEQLISRNEAGDDRVELNDGRVLMRRCRPTELQRARPVRVWAFRDITAEAQALRAVANAERRQRRLLEAFPGYIWAIDGQHRVAYVNPLAAQVYGSQPPAAGLRLDQIFLPATVASLLPSVDRALAGETLSLEWPRRSPDDRVPEHMLLKFTPGHGPDGEVCAYAFGVDVSSLKKAEVELMAARDEAERTSRVKTQFLSNMSHELRTPLNAVLGFSQLLATNTDGNLLPGQLRQLAEIQRAGNHLLTLISDLLDLARIEAGRTALELRPVPLAELAEGCLRLVQPLALHEGQTLLPAAGPALAVLADRTRLKQVLLNLLSNAIKYNRAGGTVSLRWRRDGGEVLVEVEDQGPGISAEGQARLFKPFERLHAEGSDTVGTGIGLALSQQLVLLMQGQIGVRSQPGAGSCFWLRLQPAAAAGEGSAPAFTVG